MERDGAYLGIGARRTTRERSDPRHHEVGSYHYPSLRAERAAL
jgi:hypothetical protein